MLALGYMPSLSSETHFFTASKLKAQHTTSQAPLSNLTHWDSDIETTKMMSTDSCSQLQEAKFPACPSKTRT
jgi:hypothetical protein